MRSVLLVLPSFYAGKMATIVRPCIVAGVSEVELWSKIRMASYAHKPLPPPQSNADRGVPMILSPITVHLQGPGTVVLTNLVLRFGVWGLGFGVWGLESQFWFLVFGL
jgi:hypothetical protein